MTKLEELRAQGPVKRLAGKLQGQGQGEAAAEGEGAAVLDGGEEQAEAAALRAVDPEEALAAVPSKDPAAQELAAKERIYDRMEVDRINNENALAEKARLFDHAARCFSGREDRAVGEVPQADPGQGGFFRKLKKEQKLTNALALRNWAFVGPFVSQPRGTQIHAF